jgi:hypothetical protein
MLKTLVEVQQVLNNYSYCNHGGCGVSLYTQLMWIKANDPSLFAEMRFIYRYSGVPWDSAMNTNTEYRDGDKSMASAPNHALLLMPNDELHDSDGYVSDLEDWDPDCVHIFNADEYGMEFLLTSLNVGIGTWNYWYKRSDMVRVQNETGINLGEILISRDPFVDTEVVLYKQPA